MKNSTHRPEKKVIKIENEYGLWEMVYEDAEQGQVITVSRSVWWSFDEPKLIDAVNKQQKKK